MLRQAHSQRCFSPHSPLDRPSILPESNDPDRLWCFFFLYEGLQYVQKTPTTATVLTPTARQGIYRYFPGVQSANAVAANPTVDLAGNPVIPRGATGALSSFNVFTRDPLRTSRRSH